MWPYKQIGTPVVIRVVPDFLSEGIPMLVIVTLGQLAQGSVVVNGFYFLLF